MGFWRAAICAGPGDCRRVFGPVITYINGNILAEVRVEKAARNVGLFYIAFFFSLLQSLAAE